MDDDDPYKDQPEDDNYMIRMARELEKSGVTESVVELKRPHSNMSKPVDVRPKSVLVAQSLDQGHRLQSSHSMLELNEKNKKEEEDPTVTKL